MRLRHIEVFNAVMLTGSVSAAARMINVTQPAVSRTLQHAEIQLGFQLFQRVGGRLRPTDEAQTLYPHIERLFAQLDEVQRLSASLKAGRGKGELRVLTVLALSYEVFPRAMRLFREKHPTVRVHHEALHSPQIISSLVLQEADVGYVFSAVSHPALVQEQLADRHVVCVVPKGLLPARQIRTGVITLAQLSKLPVIALDGRFSNSKAPATPAMPKGPVRNTSIDRLKLCNCNINKVNTMNSIKGTPTTIEAEPLLLSSTAPATSMWYAPSPFDAQLSLIALSLGCNCAVTVAP